MAVATFPTFMILDTLSRLKGIETIVVKAKRVIAIFWIRFPVWRELKQFYWDIPCFSFRILDTLSRLKGIETFPHHASKIHIRHDILDTLSRLKGIETRKSLGCPCAGRNFGYAFPFEGNWNLVLIMLVTAIRCFGYAFPFEGNWNYFAFFPKPLIPVDFGYAFPFEGNWNDLNSLFVSSLHANFGYAFPFEGNWNAPNRFEWCQRHLNFWIRFPVWRELKPKLTYLSLMLSAIFLDTLSRLKGIETKKSI